MKKRYNDRMGSCCFWLFGALMFCACAEEPEVAMYSWTAMSTLASSACESQLDHKACETSEWCYPVTQACVNYAEAFAFEGDEADVRNFCIESCGVMAFECQDYLDQGASLEVCTDLNRNCMRACETGPIQDPLMNPFAPSFYQ